MRKVVFLLLATLVALSFTGIPTQAQEAKTIADIVVESAQAASPEFSTLLAAVQAADPVILAALANPEASLTVFAPTNAAFEAALKALNLTAEQLLADKATLNRVLMYHVVPGSFEAAIIGAGLQDGPAILGTLVPETALQLALDGDKVKVNGGATVVSADVRAANGIIHVIDTVLLPPAAETMTEMSEAAGEDPKSALNIVEVASQTADLATLVAAVTAADPSIAKLLGSLSPITVFAPTNTAFEAAIKALNTTPEALLADQATLNKVLPYHVAPGRFSAKTVISVAGETGVNVFTLGGATLKLAVKDGKVMVNNAMVALPDIDGGNGIVHVIDAVLLPPM